MEKNKNVPAIRFKGFTEEWEEKKLGEIGNSFTGLYGKTKEDFGHGDAEFITYMNIFTNPITKRSGTEKVEIDKTQNEIQYGDIFFTTSSETPEEVGMTSVWLYKDISVYLNSFCFGYRLNIKSDAYYLAYLLRSPSIRSKIIFLAQGISRYNISKTKVMDINIQLPHINEQTQIGNFFQNIDKLIAAKQNKLDKLKTMKKACLEKMFPKKGATVPEIRFKGFSEEWEEKRLGDDEITHIYSGGTPKVGIYDYYNGNIPFIRSGEINSYKTELFISIKGLENSSAKLVKKGDILYALYGATSGEISISNIDGAINQAVLAIQPKKNYDSKFITYYLFNEKSNIINTFLQGGQGNLSGAIIKELLIKFPLYAEQTQIGTFFKNLDDLIAKNEQQIAKLKNIKKACLEKMFVNTNQAQ